jgi:hypothetical protein
MAITGPMPKLVLITWKRIPSNLDCGSQIHSFTLINHNSLRHSGVFFVFFVANIHSTKLKMTESKASSLVVTYYNFRRESIEWNFIFLMVILDKVASGIGKGLVECYRVFLLKLELYCTCLISPYKL